MDGEQFKLMDSHSFLFLEKSIINLFAFNLCQIINLLSIHLIPLFFNESSQQNL